MRTLEDKVALISGSGRGIGRATAEKFASAGACVVVNDLDADVAEATAQAIRASGGRAIACAGDATAPEFASRFVQAAAKAEIARDGRAQRRSIVNISSIAGLGGNVGQAGYAAGKSGIIGLTKTVAKEMGRYNVTVNAVAFGIIETRMTMPATGEEMIDIGGRQIKTGMGADLHAGMAAAIPLGRTGTPQEAAGAVYLLCLEEAAYITGEVVLCSGGYVL